MPGSPDEYPSGAGLLVARELRGLGLPVEFGSYADKKGEYAAQLAAGLAFALQG